MRDTERTLHYVTKENQVEWRAWHNMKRRCYTESAEGYEQLGGMGIKVCDRWLKSFADFLSDVGERPDPSMCLRRIDPTEDFKPGNVHWGSRNFTGRNTRGPRPNPPIEAQGQSKTVLEWSKHLGIPADRIRKRISYGWTVEEALELTPRTKRVRDWKTGKPTTWTYQGESRTLREWAELYGTTVDRIRDRLHVNGGDFEEALTRPKGKHFKKRQSRKG